MPSFMGVCPDKMNPCCLTYTSVNVQHLDCLRYFYENGSTSGKEITLRGTWDVAPLLLCPSEIGMADTRTDPPRPTEDNAACGCRKTQSSTGTQTDPIPGVIKRDASSCTVSRSHSTAHTSEELAALLAQMRLH